MVPEPEYIPEVDQVLGSAFTCEARQCGRPPLIHPSDGYSYSKHHLLSNLPGIHEEEENREAQAPRNSAQRVREGARPRGQRLRRLLH